MTSTLGLRRFPFSSLTALVVVGAVVGSSACGDSKTGLQSGPPAALEIVAGQAQTGVVGAELPTALEVKVVDAAGNPVGGQIVNFKVVLGGGSVFAGAAITTTDGIAKERWTLGTLVADSQSVEVRAVDPITGNALVFATFNAVAKADVPAVVAVQSGDAQAVTAGAVAPESLTVRVTDRFGNPAPNATVTWAVASGAGGVSPTTATTSVAGIASTRWTIGTTVATSQRATATVGALPATAFTANPVASAAATLVLSQTAVGATAGSAFTVQPSIRLADANGNPDLTATAPVTLTVTAGATTVGTATVAPVNGVATFTNAGLSGTVGDYTLTYTATLGGSAKTVTQPITLLAGSASKYVITPSANSAVVGAAVNLSAQLADASGNPLATSGRSVTWLRVGAGGTFSGATSTTNAAGVAAVTFTADTTFTSGSVQLAGTDANSVTGSTTITVTVGPATKLVYKTKPASGGYGVTLASTAVAVADSYGNTVTSDTRMITIAASTGTLAGTMTKAAVAGVATFTDLVYNASGSVTLTSSATGITAGTTPSFTVDPVGALGAGGGTGEITVAGSFVYFASGNTGTLNKVSATGGSVTTVAPIATHNPWMGRVRLDGAFVDVTHNGATGFGGAGSGAAGHLLRIPLDGSSQTTIELADASLTNVPKSQSGTCSAMPDLEFDGTYFVLGCTGCGGFCLGSTYVNRIERVSLDGATFRLDSLATNLNVLSAVAMSGGYVYFSDSALSSGPAINRVSVTGSSRTTLVTGVHIAPNGSRRLIVVGSTMYWAEPGAGGATSGSIRSAPITGGTATVLVSGLSPSIHSFILDGNFLYFIDKNIIKKMSLTDFSVTTVYSAQSVSEMAIDGLSIYLTTGAQVLKMAK